MNVVTYETSSKWTLFNMRFTTMFITAVCVLFFFNIFFYVYAFRPTVADSTSSGSFTNVSLGFYLYLNLRAVSQYKHVTRISWQKYVTHMLHLSRAQRKQFSLFSIRKYVKILCESNLYGLHDVWRSRVRDSRMKRVGE